MGRIHKLEASFLKCGLMKRWDVNETAVGDRKALQPMFAGLSDDAGDR